MGLTRVILPVVTPEQSDQAIKSRVLPPDLNRGVPGFDQTASALRKPSSAASASRVESKSLRVSGDSAALAPVSIAELARALGNNPDNIYHYVRNNISYYPIWGIQKGGPKPSVRRVCLRVGVWAALMACLSKQSISLFVLLVPDR